MTQTKASPQRRPPRKRRPSGWMPDQHGAWAMIGIPVLSGVVIGGFRWQHIPLLVVWWVGFFAFYATGLWLKSRRKPRYWPAVRTYGSITIIAGISALIAEWRLILWAPVFGVLVAIAVWQEITRHERSLLARFSTVFAATLMTAVAYDLGTNFQRDGHFFPFPLTSKLEALPGMSPVGGATGWAWIWVVTVVLSAYFAGTVPYVKTLIRQRGSKGWLVFSVAWHVVFFVLAAFAASHSIVTWWHVAVWGLLVLRSALVPYYSEHRERPLRPREVGLSEMVVTVLVLVTLFW